MCSIKKVPICGILKGSLIVAFIIFIPLILNFLLQITTPWGLKIIGDGTNWLGFWGSYGGAALGALVTLFAMYRESKRNALHIIIFNKENSINVLKMDLESHIHDVSFTKLADFKIGTLSNNRTINQEQVKDVLKKLDEYNDDMTARFQSWQIGYSDSDGKAKDFNDAYDTCLKEYNECVKQIKDWLGDLQSEKSEDRKDTDILKGFNDKLTDYNERLKTMQRKHTNAMIKSATIWIKTEKNELGKYKEELKTFFPCIK